MLKINFVKHCNVHYKRNRSQTSTGEWVKGQFSLRENIHPKT